MFLVGHDRCPLSRWIEQSEQSLLLARERSAVVKTSHKTKKDETRKRLMPKPEVKRLSEMKDGFNTNNDQELQAIDLRV